MQLPKVVSGVTALVACCACCAPTVTATAEAKNPKHPWCSTLQKDYTKERRAEIKLEKAEEKWELAGEGTGRKEEKAKHAVFVADQAFLEAIAATEAAEDNCKAEEGE